MKRGTKYLFCLLSALLLVFLVACGNQTTTNDSADAQIRNTSELPEPDPAPVEYTYTKETVDYTEKNGQYSFRMDMERTDTDKAHYFFEKKIVDEQRRACIEATEQILAQLGELTDVPEICVLTEKSYDSLFVVGNRVFLSEQDWQTHEYVTNVLMAVYGDFTHYGLAYGYANLLCQRLNWDNPVEGEFVEPSVVEVCDLGLLCFNTAFVSEEDANTAKSLACHFSANCDEDALKQLISVSDTTDGMDAVSSALAEYYAENGLTYQPSTVRYGLGGVSYDYIIESDICIFFLCDDWKDKLFEQHPLVSENFLHENYLETKMFWETNLKQMQQYRDLLQLEPYDEGISFVFTDDQYRHIAEYDGLKKRADILSVVNVMHEYIHALTNPMGRELWVIEGIARYFDTRFDYYGAPYISATYNENLDSPSYQFIKEYVEKIGRPVDVAIDYLEIYNLYVYSGDIFDINVDKGYPGASYIGYLVSQYGEQTVIQSIFGDETLPKTHDELVAEWVAYINETYKDYSKLKQ